MYREENRGVSNSLVVMEVVVHTANSGGRESEGRVSWKLV